MNVAAIKTRVKRRFGDEAGVQLSDSDIISSINDAQLEIVKRNESLLEVTATANADDGIQEYTLPANLLIFRSLKWKGTGELSYKPLIGRPFNEFNEYMEGWDEDVSSQGTPYTYTLYAGKFLVFPVPDSNIANAFKIYYNRKPTDVALDADVPDVPEIYHLTIVDMALKQAYEMDEDWEAASNKSAEASKDLDYLRGREDWKQQDTYPTILIRQEDM
jgi:hypothetical protein